MGHWIFKLSDQIQYLDHPGRAYVYDNRHSVKVTSEDLFVYLDKRGGGYGFTGHGTVKKVQMRSPNPTEQWHPRVNCVYTAELGDYVQYNRTLDIRLTSVEGKNNRSRLGITDVNRLGWSRSITWLNPDMFGRIIELAYQQHCIEILPPNSSDYEVRDEWSLVRRRHSIERFKETVLRRQNFTCAICGSTLEGVLDAAHISSYSTDIKNRANPANGIGLCAYCHRAFDRGIFQLNVDGVVSLLDSTGPDLITEAHLSNLSAAARRQLLNGVDLELLRHRSAHPRISRIGQENN